MWSKCLVFVLINYLPLVPFLSEINPNHTFLPCFFHIHCEKLPHGGFAPSGRASAHALRSGRMWEAAVWGATGLGFIALAMWLAPANFRGFPPPGES
jgi:hypothetical protein